MFGQSCSLPNEIALANNQQQSDALNWVRREIRKWLDEKLVFNT